MSSPSSSTIVKLAIRDCGVRAPDCRMAIESLCSRPMDSSIFCSAASRDEFISALRFAAFGWRALAVADDCTCELTLDASLSCPDS